MSIRLLGIQIANGYSPEARVFAGLLRHRSPQCDVRVIHQCWSEDSTSADRFAEEANVTLVRVDTGWRANTDGRRKVIGKVASHARFRIALSAMLREAKKFNPDVIYSCQQHWDCFAATYLARCLRKPQIIHLHYTIGKWLRQPVMKRLLTADHVITVSDFIYDEAVRHGVAPERVTTIQNAITPFDTPTPGTREAVRAELGVPLNVPLIGIVARLDDGKGQGDTISAFVEATRTYPDAYLVIVGNGVKRAALEKQAIQMGVIGRTLFTGQRSDIPRILAALDIFSHPSRYDPCPLALLEASAMGLPVVAYAEGGAQEIIVDGQTGLLAPPGDIHALADCFLKLLRDLTVARKMGFSGRDRMALQRSPADAGLQFSNVIMEVCR